MLTEISIILLHFLLSLIALFLLTLLFILLYVLIKYPTILQLKAHTIRLESPRIISPDQNNSLLSQKLIREEEKVRKLAYSGNQLTLTSAFFDDSDMKESYSLVVVYNQKTREVLLSARFYFDETLILSCLNGENENFEEQLKHFDKGSYFLADRLSANTNHPDFQKYRQHIFCHFYSEIQRENSDKNLFLMARSDQNERLLTKYLRLGFHVFGSTIHNQTKHWIVLSNLKSSKRFAKDTFIKFFLLYFKINRS